MIDTLLHIVVFIFAGNSNMNGYCAAKDNVPMHGVYWFDGTAFHDSATDENYRGDNNNSGSMVIPFLKTMRLRYPSYGFCGLKMSSACAKSIDRTIDDSHFKTLCNRINLMKAFGAIFGGAFLEYGIIEGKETALALGLRDGLLNIIKNIRYAVGVDSLPVGIVRYCLNAPIKDGIAPYRANDSIILDQMYQVMLNTFYVFTLPAHFLPTTLYCDNHHETYDGYVINAIDAACMLQERNFDFWNEGKR
jgi:hypothetical protein